MNVSLGNVMSGRKRGFYRGKSGYIQISNYQIVHLSVSKVGLLRMILIGDATLSFLVVAIYYTKN